MLGSFLRGPIGMVVISLVMTAATATTGVVAGPPLAQTIENRLNATPEPTRVPTDTPTPAPKPTLAPKKPTATRVPPKSSVSPTAAPRARATQTPTVGLAAAAAPASAAPQ